MYKCTLAWLLFPPNKSAFSFDLTFVWFPSSDPTWMPILSYKFAALNSVLACKGIHVLILLIVVATINGTHQLFGKRLGSPGPPIALEQLLHVSNSRLTHIFTATSTYA